MTNLGTRLTPVDPLLLSAVLGANAIALAKVRERERLISHLIDVATASGTIRDPEIVAIRLGREIRRRTEDTVAPQHLSPFERLETTSFFNMTTATSLKYNAYDISGIQTGPCGTRSRIMLSALWQLGIPARKLILLPPRRGGIGHTMIEFRSGGRWLVLSPSDGGFVWRRHDGRIATVAEIRADQRIFEQILKVDPNWPFRFDEIRRVRWEKLPPWLRRRLRTLAPTWYAQATTPRFFDHPRTLMLDCVVASTASLAGAHIVWNRRKTSSRFSR